MKSIKKRLPKKYLAYSTMPTYFEAFRRGLPVSGDCLIGDVAADFLPDPFTGVPCIGDEAADIFPGTLTGVPSMRLAPVLVHADTWFTEN